MNSIQTDEFGLCLNVWRARRFLEHYRLSVSSDRGALIFRYPGQEQRRVAPVFIRGRGWFYPQKELEKDYIRPEPDP